MSMIRARPSPQSSYLGLDFGNVLTSAPRPAPEFYARNNGPIPRHDNDYSNFQTVEILPTADEILAVGKPVYMPKRNLLEPNPMLAGVDRLLDLSFRQLRYESVEAIRDICYSAAQTSFLGSHTQSYSRQTTYVSRTSDLALKQDNVGQLEPRQETPLGNRYFLYQGIQVEELLSHETKSVLIRLSFDCPPFMRGRKIHHAGRFEEGMLVALLCLDTSANILDVYYLQVHALQSTDSMKGRGGQGCKAAVLASFLSDTPRAVVYQFAKFAQKLCPNVEMSLVEIPNLLYAGFGPCLSRLQKLRDFAFSELVAPSMAMQMMRININHRETYGRTSIQPCQPPRYAQESGFEFHLAPIIKPGTAVGVSSYTLGEVADSNSTAMIESMTSLDTGQAAALRHSLLSSFAFTQGPPGTGKSYLGIALTRVLLASRPPTLKKPILVVCVTNHALDSVLRGLNEAGVPGLLRIGAGSREDWTNAINLREKRSKARLGRSENFQFHGFKEDANRSLEDIDSWCRGQSSQELTGDVKWYAIQSVLFDHHRNIYDQFKSTATTPALLDLLFDFWAKGGDLKNSADLRAAIIQRLYKVRRNDHSGDRDDVEEIMDKMTTSVVEQQALLGSDSVWTIPATQRETLIMAWTSSVNTSALAADLARWYTEHQSAREKLQAIKDVRDIRVMEQANVIGMTTTACASRWNLLNALDLQIVVCEEAGEVLEPHAICSLLPTVQHAIFIGDPQQLRPEVSEHVLSLECTSNYRLDESLFEKMIFPRDPALSALPMAQLNIQRRMHPSISAISKVTYPFLEDHLWTMQHEPTIGLQQRVFWWDHRVPELEEVGTTKSHVNQHEVNMAVGLVQYLLKSGGYSQGDIAVLTPYSGQLACLHDCLKTTCTIWLNQRDRERLLSEELLDKEGPRSKDDVPVSGMLRIATVDNFQGEEAKVVILSTVRSGGRPGFLAIPNRINVACSRARNGFYIIGNSQTLGQVVMWQDIIGILNTRRGFGLTTRCPNHPDHRYDVFQPTEFGSIPECQIRCTAILPCGHVCLEKCHPLKLHMENTIPCLTPCEKQLSCSHRCSKKCGEACGECQTATAEVRLPGCGHWGQLYCSGKTSKCTFSLGTVQLECGHHTTLQCGESAEKPPCQQPCNTMLGCSHICPSTCGTCGKRGSHADCARVCGNLLRCGHRCEDDCGHEGVCPPCEKTVQTACEHGVRTKLCSQPKELCLKPQIRAFDRSDFQTPCCLPCTILPSSAICTRQLACGHDCSSLESEACIPVHKCLRCRNEKPSRVHVYVADCGHTVDVESLDVLNLQGIYAPDQDGKIIGMGGVDLASIQPPKCICGTACSSVRRYRQVTKFIELPATVETFIARAYGQLERFSFEAEALEQQLVSTFELFKNQLRSGPLAANSNRRLLMIRKDYSKDFADKIHSYRVGVVVPFEKHLAKLSESCRIIPAYQLVVSLHLHTIQTRGLIVALSDQVQVAEYLVGAQDSSSILRKTGTQLLRGAAAEAISCYQSQANLLVAAPGLQSSPSLHVEARLQEVLAWILAESALNAARMTSPTHMSSSDALCRFSASLDVAVDVSKHFPATNKPFLASVDAFRRVLSSIARGEYASSLPAIDYSGVRKIEKQYRGYSRAVGSGVAVCSIGHPFFEAVFGVGKGGCPVCGVRVQLDDEAFRAAGAFLFEDKFLAAMKRL